MTIENLHHDQPTDQSDLNEYQRQLIAAGKKAAQEGRYVDNTEMRSGSSP